jgi:hypothetical protein
MASRTTIAAAAPIIPSPISGPGAVKGAATADRAIAQITAVRDSVRTNDFMCPPDFTKLNVVKWLVNTIFVTAALGWDLLWTKMDKPARIFVIYKYLVRRAFKSE